MFGTKLRTWMEAHIVRSKKKKDRKKGEKGFDSNCNSPRNHGPTRSPALHQVHPVDSPAKNVDGIRLHGEGGGRCGGGVRPKRSGDAANLSATVLLSGRGVVGGHGRFEGNAESSATAYASSATDAGSRPQKHHRRTESFSADSSRSNLPAPPSSVPPPLLSPTVQSPRERSRIRTNPWLSANSSGSSTAPFKSRLNLDDTSSGSGLKLTESSGSASDVNAGSAREGRAARRELKQESLSAGRSPINQNWRIASGMEIRPNIALSVQLRGSTSSTSSSPGGSSTTSNTSTGSGSGTTSSNIPSTNGNENGNENGNGSSVSSVARSARSSEDDITLNEMMGKFDESYVYEKETDILSDSDPTDCEDYIESMSDVYAARDAGDENDPLDNDDFDYIDNGSFLDLDNLDCTGRFANTGHCTYFAFTGELARRSTRLRESLMKRRNRDDAAILQRTISAKNAAKRQMSRHKKQPDEKQPSEKRKKRSLQRRKSNLKKRDPETTVPCAAAARNEDEDDDDDDDDEDDDDDTANINRVLVERMLLKNSGFNQGSRSVGGTPICLRRKKHDVNKNLPPMRSNDERSLAVRSGRGETENVKRRSNSVSYVNGNLVRRRITSTGGNTYMTTFASELALIEADKEADKKYRQLILEAEDILVNMQRNQNSVPVVPSPSRKFHNGLANKRVELIKNTELNIELALSKSRNSQPELQSGSIRDLEHTSPKRQQQFPQPCSPPLRRFAERKICSPTNGLAAAAAYKSSLDSTSQQQSPDRNLLRCHRPVVYQQHHRRQDTETSFLASRPHHAVLPHRDSLPTVNRREFRVSSTAGKEEGVTSSSSDSEERCDVRKRPPLMTFRSVDMGPIKEGSSYCPQSEPVKRKVYAGSATYGRIQKTLGEHVTLRNSDGDTATDDTDDSRRSLKEKVARLRQERLAATQDSHIFQHQLSQLRRQMLMQTIQGLKRSLEDQSATLKQTCFELEPVMSDRLP
ncbi:PREDICTED: uncharacterized protein LOC108571878 [Habropoda laboriosa]|uniref:uncharacterized protein LOC108571878 n=1 Tax=Habropoda laboriosa TaxID=597456 RepID=UPI00083D0DA2|nr:PREDICTED: uncharacterized protein LOC108571878 [Habropoda laboriosa]